MPNKVQLFCTESLNRLRLSEYVKLFSLNRAGSLRKTKDQGRISSLFTNDLNINWLKTSDQDAVGGIIRQEATASFRYNCIPQLRHHH